MEILMTLKKTNECHVHTQLFVCVHKNSLSEKYYKVHRKLTKIVSQ